MFENETNRWILAPAYDMVFSYKKDSPWVHNHQMTINGKSDDFTLEDFHECGKSALLKQGQAKTILTKVRDVVSRWRDYADDAGVNPDQRDKIHNALRLDTYKS